MSTGTQSTTDKKLNTVFFEKYGEFAKNILEVFPELTNDIKKSLDLSNDDKLALFKKEVVPIAGNPERDLTKCPGQVLPCVTLTIDLWESISAASKSAIQDYVSLLSFCCMIEGGDEDGMWNKDHMSKFLETWKEKLSSIDFGTLADKFASMFGMKDGSGNSGMPKLPEKFLKGHIAKLAEELVKDFKPEDFGFTPEEIEALEKDPGRAFEIMMRIYTTKPDAIQKSVHKIANRLKAKVMSGAIKPEEIAREAKELMEEFSENPAFVDIMENFKDMFGFEDMEFARKAGREGSARLSMVRDRLKKKLDAKKAAAAAGTQPQQGSSNSQKKGKGKK
jgi:hypothetical protein